MSHVTFHSEVTTSCACSLQYIRSLRFASSLDGTGCSTGFHCSLEWFFYAIEYDAVILYCNNYSSQAAWHCVNGDRLETGKWQNSTPHRFKTPKPIAKKLSWVIRSARRPVVPNLVEIGSGSSEEMRVFSLSFLYICKLNQKSNKVTQHIDIWRCVAR